MELEDWGSNQRRLKLADKERIVGVFRGEMVRFWQHWNTEKNQGVRCPGRDTCSYCQSSEKEKRKASGRFRINFVTRKSPKDPFVALLYEAGKTVYEQLLEINAKTPLESTIVEISRRGTGMQDTRVTVRPLEGEAKQVSPQLEKQLAMVELQSLEDPAPEAEPEEGQPARTQGQQEEDPFGAPAVAHAGEMEDDLPF